MGIQILQYEFLGPVPLSEWGPPMGEILYAVLSRDRDRFNMLHVGDCEHTDDKAFFVQHEQFKCWVEKAGSDSALYLAVFPMKDSGVQRRRAVLQRIIRSYKPPCNPAADLPEQKPSYNVRRTDDTDAGGDNGGDNGSDNGSPEMAESAPSEPADPPPPAKDAADAAPSEPDSPRGAILCPCCGSGMDLEKRIGSNSALYRCAGCNMSETRLD
ncbi:MAG: hypothetical protein OXP12_05465 [Thaumarchaeota archaeon]|nr:hypothetical protein [Nitrososphaerota archaeon]